MTATNHAVTGAIIGAAVVNPWIALPAAFLSHYVLDAIPHFGGGHGFIGTNGFKYLLVADAALCVVFVAILAATGQHHWLLLSVCAFLATLPDMFWINSYLYAAKGKAEEWKPSLYSRFAAKIQWFEKPIGSVVELVWFIGAIVVLVALLHR